jgi:DNA-directed RNA polymerase subunit RPC12/RpoP
MIIRPEYKCKHCGKIFLSVIGTVTEYTREELIKTIDNGREPDDRVVIHECADGYLGICEVRGIFLEESINSTGLPAENE